MKRVLEAMGWLTAVALFAFAGHAVLGSTALAREHASAAQDTPRTQNAPASRERQTGPREHVSPVSIMRAARTIYVRPTQHLDKKYLEYKLQKYRELQDWDLMLVTEERAADLVITFEKTALNYIFTITDPRTSVIVTSGKTVAINGLVAAENLGREIIKKIKNVRASSDNVPRKRRPRDEDPDEEESTS
jgi:hypothetical protein